MGYPSGGARFAGSTYDPTSNYRAARVFAFFEERGLTPELLRASYLHQTGLLAERFDALGAPEELMTRDRSAPLESFGGFLAVECAQAGEVARRLAEEGPDRRPRPLLPPGPGAVPLRRAARGGDGSSRRRSGCDRSILAAMTETKITLPESAIPERWYNIAADMPNPPQPVLHPGTEPSARTTSRRSSRWTSSSRRSRRTRRSRSRTPSATFTGSGGRRLPRPPPRGGARHALAHLLQVRGHKPGR